MKIVLAFLKIAGGLSGVCGALQIGSAIYMKAVPELSMILLAIGGGVLILIGVACEIR